MKRATQLILLVLLLFLLYWRFQVSFTRFFDVDEFTYTHWIARAVAGERPYIDFFFLIPPGFLWLMYPVVRLFWGSPDILIVSRLIMFGMFLILLALLGKLFAKLRSPAYALLPVVILAFLPMPYDKFLEIRPDNPMALFVFASLVFALEEHWFWSGILYGISLLILPKTIPMVLVAGIISLWQKKFTSLALGIVLSFLPFILWTVATGQAGVIWYSLTKLALEANGIGKYYIMEPHLFFFPNSSFYGGSGITAPLLINHAVWILGIFVGIVRLFTPWITANGDRKRVMAELLVAGSFFAMVASYVQFFPLKHSQYLIPIAVFVSFYAADGLISFFAWLAGRFGEASVVPVLAVFLLIMVATTISVNKGKLLVPNTAQINDFSRLLTIIPPDARVFDLEGRLMFWKHSYPICCLPMGQFLPLLSQPPPPIARVLEAERTQYIFQGDTGRLAFLSASDLAYIKTYYRPVAGWEDRLWQRK